jgi:hypothetical protein
MLTCDFNGRLGNNLFQIATTISSAKKANVDFILPKTTSAGHRGNLNVDLSMFSYSFIRGEMDNFEAYDEKNFQYEEIPTSSNLKLRGFFQSWKYFESIKQDLIDTYFRPNEMISEKLKKYPTTENSLGISVRRGDYLMLQHNHCVLSQDYYQHAINEYFQNNVDSVYVFSDDLDWCESIFGPDCNYVKEDAGTQLFLMANMKHLIMSNSTFSWWGAYLNTKQGLIIAPDPWFGPNYKDKNTEDLYYPSWIILKHESTIQPYTLTQNMFD